jgi:hypothetical protein
MLRSLQKSNQSNVWHSQSHADFPIKRNRSGTTKTKAEPFQETLIKSFSYRKRCRSDKTYTKNYSYHMTCIHGKKCIANRKSVSDSTVMYCDFCHFVRQFLTYNGLYLDRTSIPSVAKYLWTLPLCSGAQVHDIRWASCTLSTVHHA